MDAAVAHSVEHQEIYSHKKNKSSNRPFSSNSFSKIFAFTNFLSKDCESNYATVWKNEKFSLTKKIFRQINSLVIYLFSKNRYFHEIFTKNT